jgi:DNA modification methylase
MNKHKIFIADSRSMSEILDESVHLVITSPPYWQLKDLTERNEYFSEKLFPELVAVFDGIVAPHHR